MALTMDDIAKMAKVSKATVSLVINDKPGVSRDTRNRVLALIKKSGYAPLRKRRSDYGHDIGEITLLVVSSAGMVRDNFRSLPFFNNLIAALSANIESRVGSLRIISTDSENLAHEIQEIKADRKVLVLGTDLTEPQAQLINKKIRHVVFLDTYFSSVTTDFVTMDNYQGAQMAGRYIIRQGYQRIGYFASENPMSNFLERRRGFRDVLASAGLAVANDDFYFISPTESEPNGLNLSSLSHHNLPPAIFCENDYIALRLIKAAQQAHMRVPDDLAIIGFDDIFAGTVVSPELSTVHVNIKQMATQAVQQLLNQFIVKDWEPQKTLIATKLVPRQSL